MTRIAIIRHGTTSWNKAGRMQGNSDIPLDEEGMEQARRLSIRLAEEKWDLLYSSHLIRAKQTATFIAETTGLNGPLLDERLGEAGGGLLEGTTEEERIVKWGKDWRQLDLGMESNQQVVTRGMSFIKELTSGHPGKHIVLVSHGSFIRQLVAHLVPDLSIPPAMKNTSVTTLLYHNNNWACEIFNCVDHLE
ncbi:MAG TPA: histidine phosphatase family protein [Chitinophaga sp.]|uniref:histidine phosphatase family protein n=1 Tax=Chitinophaga sp. TaxID=1869181 RepID=UPI002C57465E|nr:histidine phosphatase family protein [Chitinophaga sp.]HVI47213.1 histidine phosphatase family protein [Chitinophaga sp.]